MRTFNDWQILTVGNNENANLKPVQAWTMEDIKAVAQVLTGEAVNRQQEIAKNALGNLYRELQNKRVASEVFELLLEAKFNFFSRPNVTEKERKEVDALFVIEGNIQQFVTANFSIQFTTDQNSNDCVQDSKMDTEVDVRLADGTVIGTTEKNIGVPNFVKMLAIWLEHDLARIVANGFNTPIVRNENNELVRQQVIVNAGHSFTAVDQAIYISNTLGSKNGFIGAYNDQREGLGITPARLIFRKVQFTYNRITTLENNRFINTFREGTALWVEEIVNKGYNSNQREVNNYFANTSKDLFGYASRFETVTFWNFLVNETTERYENEQKGIELISTLWNRLQDVTNREEAIQAVNETIAFVNPGENLESTFADFAVSNFMTNLNDPSLERKLEEERFENTEDRLLSELTPVVTPVDFENIDGLTNYESEEEMSAWALNYYVFTPENTVQDLQLHLGKIEGMENSFCRILGITGLDVDLFENNDPVVDIKLSNSADEIALDHYEQIIVIVGTKNKGGEYRLSVKANIGAPSVVVLVDTSGSMNTANKLEKAKKATSLFVDLAELNDLPGVGVSTFNKEAVTLEDGELDVLDQNHARNIKKDIEKIKAEGRTSIGSGIENALLQFEIDVTASNQNRIVLLSDGKENVVASNDDILSSAINSGVQIDTIGLGTDWTLNNEELETIARRTGGEFRVANDAFSVEEQCLHTLAELIDANLDSDVLEELEGNMNDIALVEDTEERISRLLTDNDLRLSNTFKTIEVTRADRRINAVISWEGEYNENIGLVLRSPDQRIFAANDQTNRVEVRRGNGYMILSVLLPKNEEQNGVWWAIPVLPTTENAIEFSIKTLITSDINIDVIENKGAIYAGENFDFDVEVSEAGAPISNASVELIIDEPLTNLGDVLSVKAPFTPEAIDVNGDQVSAKEAKLNALINSNSIAPFQNRRVNLVRLQENAFNEPGSYQSEELNVTTPGTYNFKLRVAGVTEEKEEFVRYYNFTRVVRVAADANATIFDLRFTGRTKPTFSLTVTPMDVFGNLYGPGNANQMELISRTAETDGKVVDNNNGSYTFKVQLTNVETPQLSIVIDNKVVAVPSSEIRLAIKEYERVTTLDVQKENKEKQTRKNVILS